VCPDKRPGLSVVKAAVLHGTLMRWQRSQSLLVALRGPGTNTWRACILLMAFVIVLLGSKGLYLHTAHYPDERAGNRANCVRTAQISVLAASGHSSV
jgi:hypothetical protein